ncbi:Spx/MgsR family RNA polymerase-binding regulatory protein [Bacillus mangrovi]|uniref:Spx/MgsR family RNA polymerase-binding regulatory protein n=1 Tax=Metabacillus mangrovi TaxID=1491830 RepID=A0A7X2S5A6_9BACI|nr:Spx/MgsR family RNA polymerase-binding regulatory protein [Metabacillus mangrovi]
MSLDFYWYPKCGTCRKAKKWLEEHGHKLNAIHISENPPDQDELKGLWKKSGLELKKFFNTSGQKYRELGLKDRISGMSEEEMLEVLASDGMLIKRPITASDDAVTIGFKEAEFENVWK